MKTFTVISDSFSGGGAERVLAHVVNNWAPHHGRLEAISLSNNNNYILDSEKVRIISKNIVPFRKINRVINLIFVSLKVPPKSKVILCSYANLLILLPLLKVRRCKILFRPSIDFSYIKNEIEQRFNIFLSKFIISVLTFALRYVTLIFQSDKIRNSFGKLGRVSGRVIQNPVEVDHLTFPAFERDLKSDGLNIILIGRLVPEKGFDRFLSNFTAEKNSARVHVFGEGPEGGALKELARARQLAVSFHGFQTLSDLNLVNPILVICSIIEGFPNVALEAALAGWPLVVSKEVYECLSGTAVGDYATVINCEDEIKEGTLEQIFLQHNFEDAIEQIISIRREHSIEKFIADCLES